LPYKGADEYVFAHPQLGTRYSAKGFSEALKGAQRVAGVEGRVRAFHDLRHTAITHDAAAGSSAIAVMTKAGHSDMETTKNYLHLAGVVFREEADALERRLLGEVLAGGTRGFDETGFPGTSFPHVPPRISSSGHGTQLEAREKQA
jgi:integrase